MLRQLLHTSARLRPTIRQILGSDVATGSAERVEVNGWVKSIRRQKRVAFAAISDGSTEHGLQAVFADPSLAKSFTNGCSVQITGKLVPSLGKGQEKELQVESARILGESDETYPIQKQALTTEYLRDHAHLRMRTDAMQSMARLRDQSLHALHGYFKNLDFTYTHVPIVTSSDCEGAGETFRIAPIPGSADQPGSSVQHDFFGTPAYLTVSTQLHLEALAASIARVYTLSPCFRAEPSQTGRHLAEFWMLEAECSFVESVEDICSLVEGAIRHVLLAVIPANVPSSSEEIQKRRNALEQAAKQSDRWPRMTYTTAINHLREHHAQNPDAFVFEPAWGKALQSEHERWLAEVLIQGPVFVTDYPTTLKPFYMRSNDTSVDDTRSTVACFDLLVPGVGELAGGSLREERLALIEEAICRHGLDPETYKWYTDLRRYGSTPHGGFGMGFERLVSWISGVDNIRECIPMPRWAGRMLL